MRFGLVAVLLVACAEPPSASDETNPDDVEDDTKADDPTLATQFDDGRVRVVSDRDLDAHTAAAYAQMLEDAYQFDLDHQPWTKPPLLARQPVVLRALSPDKMAADYPGLAGGAIGCCVIVMSTTMLGRATAPGVLAHEANHLQGRRSGSGLPHCLGEGTANLVQRMYLRELGVAFDVNPAITDATADDAQQALDGFMFGRELGATLRRNEALALMFTEYVRVDAGYPDLLQRAAWTIERIAELRALGWTDPLTTFKRAFHDEFGIWFSDARQSYLDFIGATEGDATSRLRNTVFE